MSRSYRILAVALVGVLVLVGIAKIVDRDLSSKGGTSSAAGTETEPVTSSDMEAATDTAGSTDSVTDVVDGDTATSTTIPPITAAGAGPAGPTPATDDDCPNTAHSALIDRANQRGALCENGAITYEFPLTTALSQPDPGTYPVYAKDMNASSTFGGHYSTMTHFVAFTRGKYKNARIAFHSVPKTSDGEYLQPLDSVGTEAQHGQSSGCIRVLPADSVRIWDWLSIGDEVRVIS